MTRQIPWLAVSAWVCSLILAATIIGAAERTFWYDEVFTLGAAAIGQPLDWGVLLRDVHPPTYALGVRALGAVFGPDAYANRLVNLPALAALIAAVWLVWGQMGRLRGAVLICLLLANGQILSLAVDLRSYALLIGFATLAQALMITARLSPGGRVLWLLPVSGFLAALHFFGAAIGLACLGLAVLRAWGAGARGAAAIGGAAGIAITAAVLVWAFAISDTSTAMGGNLWISNSTAPYVAFVDDQLPLFLLALIILAQRARPPADAVWSIAAPLAVVAVGLIISLHSPIVSERNLVVCIPGLAFAVALTLPEDLLRRMNATPIFLIGVALFAARDGISATDNRQMIGWAMRTAAPPACDGAPIYVTRPGIVYVMAQSVFAGDIRRPVMDLRDLTPDVQLPEGCDVIAMGWHELGDVSDITDFVTDLGLPARAILPPDPVMAARARQSPGFVITLAP